MDTLSDDAEEIDAAAIHVEDMFACGGVDGE